MNSLTDLPQILIDELVKSTEVFLGLLKKNLKIESLGSRQSWVPKLVSLYI